MMVISNGAAICAEYNYQPNNNTERYMECFNTAGATVLPQTKIYAKTNDNCSMNQDGASDPRGFYYSSGLQRSIS